MCVIPHKNRARALRDKKHRQWANFTRPDETTQGQSIVEKEANLPPHITEKTEVFLLDGNLKVIASSNPARLHTHFALHNPGNGMRGNYYDNSGNIVAYARTLGYEDYDGLGWYGVIVQQTDSDDAIRPQFGLK